MIPPRNSQSSLSNFRTSEDGAVAILFALMFGALLLFVGLAVDISRLNSVRSQVQSSLDAASLAAAKMIDGSSSATAADVQAMAATYFNENLKNNNVQGAKLANFTALADMTTGAVQVKVDLDLPMYFAGAGNGLKSISTAPSATANYKTVRLEVSMVLDNTGSMSDPSADGTPKIQALKRVAKEFIDALYSSMPQPDFVRVALVPYSASVNIGDLANQLAGRGLDTCVVDRPGSFAYTDGAPSKMAPLSRGDTSLNPYYLCPAANVVALTDLLDSGARDTFKASIDAMSANGATAGHIGAAWGWYALSPSWANIWDTYAPRPYATNVKKILILLTDGQFNTAYNNGGAALDPATTALDPSVSGSSPYQAANICQNIKTGAPADQAITIYTIGFTAPPSAEAFLKSCSGANNFYSADSSSSLSASFRDIVTKLTILRLSS